MLKKTIILVFITICFPSWSSAKRKSNWTRVHQYRYPELYRDHVFDTLSEKGKEMFHAIEIHPSCVAKKGQCIPRAQCVDKEMLYISRICYKRDLVCCYDNIIRFPEVGDKYHTSATEKESNVSLTTALPSTTPLP